MKSNVLFLSLIAMLCISTVATCELIDDPWWEGTGGTGDYSGSEASAYAIGDTDYEENCASGSYDIATTEAGYFSVSYVIEASAHAACCTNDNWGSFSEAYGSGYGDVSGGPIGSEYLSASANISGGSSGWEYDYDYPSSCTVYFHFRSLTLSGANNLCRL